MAITKSPPWETFYNEIVAIFAGDKDIKVIRDYTDKEKRIKLLVNNHKKYDVLSKYLVPEKLFGTVTVKIDIVDSNAPAAATPGKDMQTLFEGNKNVSIVDTQLIPGGSVTYVAFKNGVVQFSDDNLADLHRNKTMLMESIARDVFKLPIDGVYFCTDEPERASKNTFTTSQKLDKKDIDYVSKLIKDLF